MPIIFQNRLHPSDPVFNPSVWYVVESGSEWRPPMHGFADNVIMFECRINRHFHWSDAYYEDNVKKFEEQLGHIRRMLKVRAIVVFPSEFMYEMEDHAPKTFRYCFDRVLEVAEEDNRHLDGVKELTSGEGF